MDLRPNKLPFFKVHFLLEHNLTHSCTFVHGCFIEWSSCDKTCLAHKAKTIHYLALCRKKKKKKKKNLSNSWIRRNTIVSIFSIFIILSITMSSSFIPIISTMVQIHGPAPLAMAVVLSTSPTIPSSRSCLAISNSHLFHRTRSVRPTQVPKWHDPYFWLWQVISKRKNPS